METSNLSFSDALKILRAGEIVYREGWNGKNQYLELQVPDEHSKMTLPYIFMTIIKSSGVSRVPWLASQTDILSSDWAVYDGPTSA